GRFFATFVDPLGLVMYLGIPLFMMLLCRRAWRALGAYRKLAPDADQALPRPRRLGGALTWSGSCLLFVSLASLAVMIASSSLGQPPLPPDIATKEREALRQFNDGVARMGKDPVGAEVAFGAALRGWQELTKTAPSRPEYRQNVA